MSTKIITMEARITKPKEKESRDKRVVTKDGEIGILKNGTFQSYTNFSMEVVHAVRSPPGASVTLFGHVYLIKSSDGLER